MSVSRFQTLPGFDTTLAVGVFSRGEDIVRLSAAIAKAVSGEAAYEARRALGDPASAVRREKALRILEAMPARQQQKILDAYHRGKRTPGEAA